MSFCCKMTEEVGLSSSILVILQHGKAGKLPNSCEHTSTSVGNLGAAEPRIAFRADRGVSLFDSTLYAVTQLNNPILCVI